MAPATPPAPPPEPAPAAPLPPHAGPGPLIADIHEPREIVAAISARGVPVQVRHIQPADYVVGPVAVERKTVGDFASSLFNKRLFDQVRRITETYEQALLVVEGDLTRFEDFANPGAFYGAMCHVSLDRRVSVIPTPDRDHTALLLATLHKRLEKEPTAYALRHKPPAMGPREEVLFLVQGLPHVGGVLSERLLEHFGTARRVMRAQERELRRIPLVGPEKARRITEALDRPWTGRQARLEEREGGEAKEEDA